MKIYLLSTTEYICGEEITSIIKAFYSRDAAQQYAEDIKVSEEYGKVDSYSVSKIDLE